MKTTKLIIAGLSVCAIALLAGQSVQAANPSTKGTITFDVGSPEGSTTTPNEEAGEPEDLTVAPEDGTETTTGAIRIQFVPNFTFGTHDGISAAKSEQDVQLIGYTPKGGSRQPIAPFAQVADYRGEKGDKAFWKLEVSATRFENKTSGDVLNNVEIMLPGSTLTMDYKNSTAAQALVEGQGTDESITTDGGKTTIMQTKPQQDTSGYNVSNVFHNDYKKGMEYKNPAGNVITTTSGVKFVKPKGEAPVKGVEYTSTLTWSLELAP